MSLRIEFEPLQALFEPGPPYSQELLKETIVRDFKAKSLIGVPDAALQIHFSPEDGSDILIHKLDPEKALGYSVHSSEQDYFDSLNASLYEPTEEDVTRGQRG